MQEVSTMTLRSGQGIANDANPSGRTPRQVTIGLTESLAAHGVSSQGARCNIVLADDAEIRAGAVLAIDGVMLRVTMSCEPCNYGARMADARMVDFRQIRRYLAIVLQGGVIETGISASIQLGVYPESPDDFRARCAWALDYIPKGSFTRAPEFLEAIGAGPAYARTLPRWMTMAKAAGKPVHRVLSAGLTPPSWCNEALALLADEQASGLEPAQFNLMQALWF